MTETMILMVGVGGCFTGLSIGLPVGATGMALYRDFVHRREIKEIHEHNAREVKLLMDLAQEVGRQTGKNDIQTFHFRRSGGFLGLQKKVLTVVYDCHAKRPRDVAGDTQNFRLFPSISPELMKEISTFLGTAAHVAPAVFAAA